MNPPIAGGDRRRPALAANALLLATAMALRTQDCLYVPTTERTLDPAATDGELDIRLAIKERKTVPFRIPQFGH